MLLIYVSLDVIVFVFCLRYTAAPKGEQAETKKRRDSHPSMLFRDGVCAGYVSELFVGWEKGWLYN